MKSFIGVLLIAKIGFICHEAVTSLKLLEKGFSREDLALSVLLDFPLQIFFGYYAAKWSNGQRPLKPVMKKKKKKKRSQVGKILTVCIVALCFLWSFSLFCPGYAYCSLLS